MTKQLPVLLLVCLAACSGGESELVAAVQAPLSDAQYAGRTSNADLFGVVVVGEGGVEAYFCDNQKDHWFRGSANGPVLELDNGAAKLSLLVEGSRAVGQLVEGEVVTSFDFAPVSGDVLFRAETAMGTAPVLGGWIRLPDGEQRGVVRVDLVPIPSSLNPALEAVCAVCGALAITPAPYTPSSVQKRPNVPARFTVIALGDSMMAGEGAPVTVGMHSDDGTTGTPEHWSNGLPTPSTRGFTLPAPLTASVLADEAKRCHRGASGAGIAVADLRLSWGRVDLIHQNFACSGARTDTMVNPGSYTGPGGCGALSGQAKTDCLAQTDDLATPVPSQTTAMDAFLDANGLTADAVLLSIGVNNLGFSKIIADCVKNDCAASDSDARAIFASGAADLPADYAALADKFTRMGILAKNVHISKYPNPLRRTSTDLCNGSEFNDLVLGGIDEDEAAFANTTQGKINNLVAAGAADAGWDLVDSHIGTEGGHGMCAATPWFNTTPAALHAQGSDLPPQLYGAIHVSAGMVHPNQAGQRDMYAPAWKSMLDAQLRARFTPKTPTNLRATKFEDIGGGQLKVTLAWNDVNLNESTTVVRGTGDVAGTGTKTVVGDVTTLFLVVNKPAGRTPKATFFVKSCFDTGSEQLCSAESAPLDVEVEQPKVRPADVRVFLPINPSLSRALVWTDKAPSKIFSTVELDLGTSVSRVAVEGQSMPIPAGLRRFRVATCNQLGCGAVSSWVDL